MNGLSAAWRAVTTAGHDGLALAEPWGLLGLLAVLALVVTRWLSRDRARTRLTHSRAHLFASLPTGRPRLWLWLVDGLMALVALLLVLALARPQLLGAPDPHHEEGIDIVAVLDVSGSMRAADFKPKDRLTVAKRTIDEQLFERERDRIGLVVFAGEAFTQAPLTHDTGLLREFLAGVRTGVLVEGTAIGDAVAVATNRLRDSKAKSRVIILVTDGDNNAGALSPDKAAELAAEFDIRIFPILVGRGGRVPFPQQTPDILGQTRYAYVEIPTNPALLKRMANTTGGSFYTATDADSLETSFQTILNQMDKTVLEAGPLVRKKIELYPLALLAALLALFVAFGLRVSKAQVAP